MSQAEEIRKSVSDSYARAVASGAGCGCGCATTASDASAAASGPLPGSGPTDLSTFAATPKGVAARAAGYSAEELSAIPADAVTNSFGCGNPVAFSGVRPGEVVLDLGSGAGIDLLLAARKVGPEGRVIGIDMTDAMIERARQNVAAAGHANVEVRKGLIEELPVETGSVDWVISNCVINLSPEKERVFREIFRVLKPGGRLLVSDIVVEDLPAWARESAAIYASCIGGAISEKEYLAGLEAAGLTEVRVEDRLVYDGGELSALVESEVSAEAAGCCGTSVADLARELAPAFAGKVWSARFAARKPAAG